MLTRWTDLNHTEYRSITFVTLETAKGSSKLAYNRRPRRLKGYLKITLRTRVLIEFAKSSYNPAISFELSYGIELNSLLRRDPEFVVEQIFALGRHQNG